MRERIALGIGLAVILVAIFLQSYNGRRDVVNALRKGCVRGMSDRHANAEAWYSAYRARIAQAQRTPGQLGAEYRASANVYLKSAESLNSRTSPAYSVQWPDGSGHLPLGPGHLDCAKAFPSATPFQFFN